MNVCGRGALQARLLSADAYFGPRGRQTIIDPSFWHDLGALKLDTLRLSEEVQPLTGAHCKAELLCFTLAWGWAYFHSLLLGRLPQRGKQRTVPSVPAV